MIEIEFTTDFAGRKKGDKWECSLSLASHLIRVDKVAKIATVKKVAEAK